MKVTSSIRHALVSVMLLAGCSGNPNGPSEAMTFGFDFDRGQMGFVAGFADYPPADEAIYRLTSDYRALPATLDASRNALFISGINRSDDLFMYFKGQVNGLGANTRYRASFAVEFATNVPSGCSGVGGAPGESVWVKAGATTVEPVAFDDGGQLRMNIDKGNQANGGANAVVLGNVANSRLCQQLPQWELKSVNSSGAMVEVTSDRNGRVWLLFGTDSGFESLTALYYTHVSVTFLPQ